MLHVTETPSSPPLRHYHYFTLYFSLVWLHCCPCCVPYYTAVKRNTKVTAAFLLLPSIYPYYTQYAHTHTVPVEEFFCHCQQDSLFCHKKRKSVNLSTSTHSRDRVALHSQSLPTNQGRKENETLMLFNRKTTATTTAFKPDQKEKKFFLLLSIAFVQI